MNIPTYRAAAHVWTLAPVLRHMVRPISVPRGERWSLTVQPEGRGPVRLSGLLHRQADASDLVILIHGLGGGVGSAYMLSGLLQLLDAGYSVLRINLRGADLKGGDFYHAGLTEDVHAIVESLQSDERIWIMGYSLGGHLALKAATEDLDPRVLGVVGICPPIDLERTQQHLDTVSWPIYRRYMLDALKKMYGAIARRDPVPTPASRMRSVQTILEWDTLTVAPRFGFDSAHDYYVKSSVAHRVEQLDRRALVIAAEHDPFIPAGPLREIIDGGGHPLLTLSWSPWGGHVGYPPNQPPEATAIEWMAQTR
ncbi:MAG: YheT family hydrolase [Bradymonadia bacterium]